MTTIANESPRAAIRKLENNWGWFAALGVVMIIAGGIASLNLVASTLASILYIVAFMVFCGLMQLFHAINTHGWMRRSLYALSAVSYLAASALAFYDPIFSAVGIALLIGVLLVTSGVFRIISGARDQSHEGWGWMVASGIMTLIVGAILLVAWPAIGLWLLGALLTADLVFQGCSYIAFGLALRQRRARQDPDFHYD